MFLVFLLTEDVPDAPENVRVVSVTKSEIKIKWDNAKAKPCCPVIAYSVNYGRDGGKYMT